MTCFWMWTDFLCSFIWQYHFLGFLVIISLTLGTMAMCWIQNQSRQISSMQRCGSGKDLWGNADHGMQGVQGNLYFLIFINIILFGIFFNSLRKKKDIAAHPAINCQLIGYLTVCSIFAQLSQLSSQLSNNCNWSLNCLFRLEQLSQCIQVNNYSIALSKFIVLSQGDTSM